MAKMNYVLAMVALGGLSAGAASAATPITVTLDIPDTGTTPINLVGGPGLTSPQFWYGTPEGSPPVLFTGEFFADVVVPGLGFTYQNAVIGDKSTTNPGIPTFSDVTSVGEPFAFAYKPSPTYFQLAFQNGDTTYVGYAYVDADYTLEYITFEPVPEPAAWALLIAGVGLAGAAVRTRRRKDLVAA